MKECCKGQSTPHCPECGANLKANTLLGLKEYLEKRLKAAAETLQEWMNTAYTTPAAEKKVKQGIARNLRNVEQLKDWIAKLSLLLEPTTATPPRNMRMD